jgi:hypothetical protein
MSPDERLIETRIAKETGVLAKDLRKNIFRQRSELSKGNLRAGPTLSMKVLSVLRRPLPSLKQMRK